jgi:PAS domain S-box-containing protein
MQHILYLEDDPRDAELVSEKLIRSAVAHKLHIVGNRKDFESALATNRYDLILSDYNLSDYDGMSAMVLARERQPGVPFILISGTMGEEKAVDCVLHGATDYVLKHRLERLVPAVLRAVAEAEEQRRLHEAEKSLRNNERRMALLVSATPAIIYTCRIDRQFGITFISENVEQRLGYDPQEFIRNPAFRASLIDAADRDHVFAELENLSVQDQCQIEYRLKAKDGSWRWILDEMRVVRDEHGTPSEYIGYMIDITSRKELESQLAQSQKMEVVGQLAGGIAHDFNNILSAILGFSEMALTDMQPDNEFRDHILEIKKAGERAAELTSQLLTFSRKHTVDPRILNLNAVISDFSKMLGRLVREDIAMEIRPMAKDSRVKADPGQLEQVISNMVINARDAMPNGGKLTIETSNVTLSESGLNGVAEGKAGDYVLLSISDTGEGMTEEIQSRIFEPFFTTKPVGKGTGLGLASCYGAIRQSGGFITISSHVGQGTTFKIHLPLVAQEVPSNVSSSLMGALPTGNETILLVEDDDAVRKLANMILSSLGYNVLTAVDGEDGLRIGQKQQGKIDLLLTDVIMPKMNGRKMASELLRQFPHIKVIFLSGYASKVILQDNESLSNEPHVNKPFVASNLAQKVRAVLDEPKT